MGSSTRVVTKEGRSRERWSGVGGRGKERRSPAKVGGETALPEGNADGRGGNAVVARSGRGERGRKQEGHEAEEGRAARGVR